MGIYLICSIKYFSQHHSQGNCSSLPTQKDTGEELRESDWCLRTKLRTNNTQTNRDNYRSSLAKMQTKILLKHSQLKRSFREWEIQQVTSTGKEPWSEELFKNSTMKETYKSLNLAEQLLKHWNINIHL